MKNISKIKFSQLAVLLTVFFCGTVKAESFLPEYSKFELHNGLRVYVIEDHRQPTVYFRMNILSGSASDSAHPGLNALTAEILKENTKNYPDGKLTIQVDSMGGSLLSYISRDVSYITGDFLSRDFIPAMYHLADMVMHAEFREEDSERMKRRLITMLAQVESVYRDLFVNEIFKYFYGSNGYGAYVYGTPKAYFDYSVDDIKQCYEKYYRPNNAVLVIGGDVETGQVKKLVKQLFGSWENGRQIPGAFKENKQSDSLNIYIYDRPAKSASEFIVGRPGIAPDDPEYAGLLVLNYILGSGGRVSRLNKNLIQDKAIATHINSSIDCSSLGGMFYIQGGAPVESSADAISGILETMQSLREIRIPVAEFKEAQAYFYGSQVRNYASFVNAVNDISRNMICGLSPEYSEKILEQIQKLDLEQMRKFSNKFLDPNQYVVLIAGPSRELRAQLKDIAPISVISPGKE